MNIKTILDAFKDRRILVIGDLILDHYVWGRVTRISPEAPVPVVDVSRETYLLGGSANVANNIVSLGGAASVIGIVGDDMSGRVLVDMMKEKGFDCSGVFVENRPTTVKTRVIAHSQQIVRFDREDRKYVRGKILKGILDHIKSVWRGHDAIIISDYRKGLVSAELIKGIRRITFSGPKGGRMFIAVDPKMGHFDYYKGVSLITPNTLEAADGSGIEIKDDASLVKAGKALMRRTGCEAVLLTRGENGMSLFEKKHITHIPTVARQVYDVTGAGDTVISAFTLAYSSGASMEESAIIANHAAGIVVGEVGTAVTTTDRITASFK